MKFQPFASPRSFVFKDPDTGFKFAARDKAGLIKHIVSYRVQNDLEPIEALESVLENYWCGLPENIGSCKQVKLKRGFLQYIKGGISLVSNLMFESFVPQKVADARSEICAGCKFNVFPDKGPFIAWSDEIAVHSIGEKKSARHKDLGNCDVCSCPMKAKVWHPGPFKLSEEEKEKMKSVNCWQI